MNTETTHTIVVLNDGSTFTSIEGCTIQVIDDDQMEELSNGGSPDNLAHHPLETFDMQDVLERSENKLKVYTARTGDYSEHQMVDPVEAFLRLADDLEDIRSRFQACDFDISLSDLLFLMDVCWKAQFSATAFRENAGAIH